MTLDTQSTSLLKLLSRTMGVTDEFVRSWHKVESEIFKSFRNLLLSIAVIFLKASFKFVSSSKGLN